MYIYLYSVKYLKHFIPGTNADIKMEPVQADEPNHQQPHISQPHPQEHMVVIHGQADSHQKWTWGIVVLSLFAFFCCEVQCTINTVKFFI